MNIYIELLCVGEKLSCLRTITKKPALTQNWDRKNIMLEKIEYLRTIVAEKPTLTQNISIETISPNFPSKGRGVDLFLLTFFAAFLQKVSFCFKSSNGWYGYLPFFSFSLAANTFIFVAKSFLYGTTYEFIPFLLGIR